MSESSSNIRLPAAERPSPAGLVPVLIAILMGGCSSGDQEAVRLDFTQVEQIVHERPGALSLMVAVAAMTGPQEVHASYAELVEYLGTQTNRETKLVQRRTYGEVNGLLRQGAVDVAFLCSGGYADAKSTGSVELLAVPVIHGETTYQSYLIVPSESDDSCLLDLRGKRFAFTDSLSLTGFRYPVHLLHSEDVSPGEFFAETIFTHSHDKSIRAVARGMADGACVDGLVYDHLALHFPQKVSNLKVVHRSLPFGIPPVVVRSSLDPALKARLESVLLTMPEGENGRDILRRVGIDRFIRGSDSLYQDVYRVFSGR